MIRTLLPVFLLVGLFGAGRAAGGEEAPFTRYDPPGPSLDATAGKWYREKHAAAEAAFARRDYLAAVCEYRDYWGSSWPGGDDESYGLDAEIGEHCLTAMMNVLIDEPGVDVVHRLRYPDGRVSYLLLWEPRPEENEMKVALIKPGGERLERRVPVRRSVNKGTVDPVPPEEWTPRGTRGDLCPVRRGFKEELDYYLGVSGNLTYGYNFEHVSTVIRALRVREAWLKHQGTAGRKLAETYCTAARRNPTMDHVYGLLPGPNLLILADFCARQPEHRAALLEVLAKGLLPDAEGTGEARISLDVVRTLNAWVPVAVTREELTAARLAEEWEQSFERRAWIGIAAGLTGLLLGLGSAALIFRRRPANRS